MTTIKDRLSKLEQRTPPAIENPYMSMPIEELFNRAWEAIERGDPPPPDVLTPEGAVAKLEILRRLEKIAEAKRLEQTAEANQTGEYKP